MLSIGVKEGEPVAIAVSSQRRPAGQAEATQDGQRAVTAKPPPRENGPVPAARQMVADAGVDVRQLHGSGREGASPRKTSSPTWSSRSRPRLQRKPACRGEAEVAGASSAGPDPG